MARGEETQAVKQYRAAMAIDPYFSASYVNLADMFRDQGNDPKGIELINEGLLKLPNDPDLNFTKALQLVRSGKNKEALAYLDRAVYYAPLNARYAYVYGVALNDRGQRDKAVLVLEKSLGKSPNDGNLIFMLMTISRQKGELRLALKYADRLQKIFPDNAQIRQQVENLKRQILNQK